MNFLAHGWHCLHRPYLLAGTAAPDWLRVVDRRLRLRPRAMHDWVQGADRVCSEVARGVLRHHADDAWFHATEAFQTLQWECARLLRERLPGDEGFRPSFVGHVLVELLLDAVLAERQPAHLAAYYGALEALDPVELAGAIGRMTAMGSPPGAMNGTVLHPAAVEVAGPLAALIERFLCDRFLYDYADDGKLLTRLNRVLDRVGLAPLPEAVQEVLPRMREQVRRRWRALWTP